MKLHHRGFVIETFQQFVGVWICRYSGIESGDIAATTERRGVAKCKAEVLHIRRHRRILDDRAYAARIDRRCRRRWAA